MQRECILHVKINIDRIWLYTSTQSGRYAAIRKLVESYDILRHLVEVRNGTFRKGRSCFLDLVGREITRTFNPQPPYLTLDYLQNNNAALNLLRMNLHRDCLKSFGLIGFLKRRTRLIDILSSAFRTKERIDRLLNFQFG